MIYTITGIVLILFGGSWFSHEWDRVRTSDKYESGLAGFMALFIVMVGVLILGCSVAFWVISKTN